MFESLFIKSILISPIAFGLYLLAAMALGWTLYGLRGYGHWVRRLSRYGSIPRKRRMQPGYGYVEYIPEVVRPLNVVRGQFVPPAPVAQPTVPLYSTKDDLKIVEGIGPKIEGILNSNGIYTWRELALTPNENIRRMLDQAGNQYHAHDPQTWGKQAAMADQGLWNELKELQDTLDSTQKK